MHHRITTCVLFVLLSLASIQGASGQDIPRRPDGKPDLSGTYDVGTLTPLLRPERYGNRVEMTAEEAEALESYWATNMAKDYEPSNPDRTAPPEGGVAVQIPEAEGAAGKTGGYNHFYLDNGTTAFKLDGKYRTSILTDPPNGHMPPLTELGRQRAQYAALNRHENTGTAWWMDREVGPYDDVELRPLAERCILARGAAGAPVLPSGYNNIKRVVQTDDYVMITIEWMHDVRIIRLNDERLPEDLLQWSGDSIGSWDGDTLVVETTNYREGNGVSRAALGLRVIERFSRIDADTLRYQFTVHDPAFQQPYSGEYPWPSTDDLLYEYACHEGNYSLGGILRGARLLEQEAKEDSSSP